MDRWVTLGLLGAGWVLAACSNGAADDVPIGEGTGSTRGRDAGTNTGGIKLVGAAGSSATNTGGSAGSTGMLCGNSQLDADETCDDANSRPGDGCSGICQIEPGFECPEPGQPCTLVVVCGDATVTGIEACDDGYTESGDGCSANCSSVEDGYSCPLAGGPCIPTEQACGNGTVDSDEECDDGNGTAGDGCSANCRQEPGYLCPLEGGACTPIEVCGDGIVSFTRNETCDDANTDPGDGCSKACRVESGWACTADRPSVCTYDVVCGDQRIRGAETCDDGNDSDGDGCSADCLLEPGWTCPTLGAACRPLCGDAIVLQREECDDGNTDAGDGCSPTCQEEPGWVCDEGEPCRATVCGDGVLEGSEACDDGNPVPFDGCSSSCVNEPSCGSATSAVGECTSVCGDGIQLRGTEECEDGNLLDGDGCSHDCQIEPGWTCTSAYDNPPTQLDLPIVARDFESYVDGSPPSGHPDFGHYCCDDSLERGQGVVGAALGLDRKPVWAGPTQVADPSQLLFTGKQEFDQWYRDVADVNMTYYGDVTLLQSATDATTYAMNSDTDPPWLDLCGFFPLDDLAQPLIDQNTGVQVTYTDGAFPDQTCLAYQGLGFGNGWANHNYSFTTELRYWFQYEGNESLEFTGDDDVWVFINGTLAVAMPGTHNRAVGDAVLDAANGTAEITYPNNSSLNTSVDLGLTVGDVYEVVVFQAERWCCGSNYMLTLANFLGGTSTCAPTCGDGVVTADEACDLGVDAAGVSLNTGEYGGCGPDCTLAPFCGDGIVNGPETCDDGTNTAPYDSSRAACAPGCVPPSFCGDGVVDSFYGEECDLGAENSSSAYGAGACTDTCELAPFCGDGLQNGPEACDDGPLNGTTESTCSTVCSSPCGDGVRDPGEQCDLGAALNTGEYNGCTAQCTPGPHCGDGVKNGPEECDDGVNDGSYGTCMPDCTLGEYCGDGVKNGPEECDDGDDNLVDPYGPGLCTTQCLVGPYCGDGIIQDPEQCDGTTDCDDACVLRPPE